MKKLTIAMLFICWSAVPAWAFFGQTGVVEDLEFVTETLIPGPGETSMSLCHLTEGLRIFGFPLTRDIKGYVLADDHCKGRPYREFNADQLATAQSLKLITTDIPTEARNDLDRNLQTYGVWIAIALALFAVIWRRVKSLLGFDVRGPMRKRAAQRIMSALCYAAKCDGLVSSREVNLVALTAKRLTQHDFRLADIMRVADQIELDLNDNDYIEFGRGLRDREKDVMLQGVLYVTMSDGQMLPREYDFVTRLAHGLGVPGADFRRMLNTAMDDIFDPGSNL